MLQVILLRQVSGWAVWGLHLAKLPKSASISKECLNRILQCFGGASRAGCAVCWWPRGQLDAIESGRGLSCWGCHAETFLRWCGKRSVNLSHTPYELSRARSPQRMGPQRTTNFPHRRRLGRNWSRHMLQPPQQRKLLLRPTTEPPL